MPDAESTSAGDGRSNPHANQVSHYQGPPHSAARQRRKPSRRTGASNLEFLHGSFSDVSDIHTQETLVNRLTQLMATTGDLSIKGEDGEGGNQTTAG